MPRVPKSPKNKAVAETKEPTTTSEVSSTESAPSTPTKKTKKAVPQTKVAKQKSVKAKKTSKKTSHPTFEIMIAKAIIADANRKGSSRDAIKKYLKANYGILPENPHLKHALHSLVARSEGPRLLAPNSGRFRVSPELRKKIIEEGKEKQKKTPKKIKKTKKRSASPKKKSSPKKASKPKKVSKTKKTTKAVKPKTTKETSVITTDTSRLCFIIMQKIKQTDKKQRKMNG